METVEHSPPPETIEVALKITVAAPRGRVWKSLTEDLNQWWHKKHRFAPGPSRMVFEPVPGGRLYEDYGGGDGLLWYTVVHIARPERILLTGTILPPFAGPASTHLRLELNETSEGTMLTVNDIISGNLYEKFGDETVEGWKELLVDGLKKHAEADH